MWRLDAIRIIIDGVAGEHDNAGIHNPGLPKIKVGQEILISCSPGVRSIVLGDSFGQYCFVVVPFGMSAASLHTRPSGQHIGLIYKVPALRPIYSDIVLNLGEIAVHDGRCEDGQHDRGRGEQILGLLPYPKTSRAFHLH